MEEVTCRAQQGVQIGEDIVIGVVSVEPGLVRLSISAPGRRLTRIDPIPLPGDAGGSERAGLERILPWPQGKSIK